MNDVGIYDRFIKRFLDIIFSVLLLLVLTIPFLLIAIWIKLGSEGPVVFKQKRASKNLKPFVIYKFRSMSVGAPKYQTTNDMLDSGKYITSAGKIMRKLSIDELPQLVNVLKGEMSIVGPRPVILSEFDLLSEREKYNANSCKPGITGWAQVNGRDELHVKEKAAMDGFYVEHFGIVMDIKCLAMTLMAVLSMQGHREGHENGGVVDFDEASIVQVLEYCRLEKL